VVTGDTGPAGLGGLAGQGDAVLHKPVRPGDLLQQLLHSLSRH